MADLLSKLLAEKEDLTRRLEENASNIAELSGEDIGRSLVEPASSAIANIPPLRWAVPGLIHSVGFGVLASAPFVGKTFLSAAMAGSLASGRPLFGSFVPTCAMPVLYVYYESNRSEFVWGLKRTLESRGISGENIFVKTAKTSGERLQVGSPGLEAAIRATGAKVIFLDTLAFANPATESNDDMQAKLVKPLTALVEATETFAFLIHHAQKQVQGVEGIYQLRGGTVLSGAADVILRIERVKGQEKDSKHRTLVIEKVRGAPAGEISLEMDFNRRIAWEVGQDPREILWTPERYAAAKQVDPFED